MKISSPEFQGEGVMPERYTCDGSDINPPLAIEGVPETAKSLALILDDPDAPMGTWTHWTVWNLRPNLKMIEEGNVPAGAVQGDTDFSRIGYGGPCPPFGTHRYYFRLFALKKKLDLPVGSGIKDLEKAMVGQILDTAEIMVRYTRHN